MVKNPHMPGMDCFRASFGANSLTMPITPCFFAGGIYGALVHFNPLAQGSSLPISRGGPPTFLE